MCNEITLTLLYHYEQLKYNTCSCYFNTLIAVGCCFIWLLISHISFWVVFYQEFISSLLCWTSFFSGDVLESNLYWLGMSVFLLKVGGSLQALLLPPSIKTDRHEIAHYCWKWRLSPINQPHLIESCLSKLYLLVGTFYFNCSMCLQAR